MNIPLGYEVPTGRPVSVPLKHLAVTGQTQESGKTTTLEALITRSGLRAVAFITKRGEKSFRLSRPIPPFFREASSGQYWNYVVAIVEGMLEIKLGFQERGWIIKLCQDYEKPHPASAKKKGNLYQWKAPKSLAALLANLRVAKPHLRGSAEVVCMQLDEYLESITPEIARAQFTNKLELTPGINVMDIAHLSTTLQALVIRAVIEWVHQKERRTIVIVPEAWKFIPRRTTPVKQAAERLIREGAALQNFVWLDSQDLRGVDPLLLRSIGVWIFGVQRERNEVANTLESIPDLPKPQPADIMRLKKGQFFAAYGETCTLTYVRPAGMGEEHAKAIARGEESADSWKSIVASLDAEQSANGDAEEAGPDSRAVAPRGEVLTDPESEKEEAMWKERAEKAEAEVARLTGEVGLLREEVHKLNNALLTMGEEQKPVAIPPSKQGMPLNGSVESIWPEIRRRISADPVLLQLAAAKPEIVVNVKRRTIEMSDGTLSGRIAKLLAQGFFKTPRAFGDLRAELIRIGAMDKKSGNAPVGNALANLNEQGFLTNEEAGWQEVPGVKARIVEE